MRDILPPARRELRESIEFDIYNMVEMVCKRDDVALSQDQICEIASVAASDIMRRVKKKA